MKTMQAVRAPRFGPIAVRADMAARETEAARRDKDNLRWQIGLAIAIVVVLGFLIRL